MRLIIIAILSILWLLFGIFYVKPCFETAWGCASDSSEGAAAALVEPTDEKNAEATPAATSKVRGPILFNWDKAKPITGDGWNARQKAIIDGLGANEILEITGQYRADEANTTTFENLGLARAHEVADLLKPPLTDEQLRLKGQLVRTKDTDKSSPFKSVAFKNMRNSSAIKEVDDKTTIYFPFNSVNKLDNNEIETYLNEVADRVKKSGEKVRLTGHTDNVDSEAFNQALGLRRANIVKDYLISRGVPAAQIIAISKGETEPIKSNDTKEGRADNRRTELEIIK